ncbi:unnamed protein product [Lampetra planeri]
MNSLSSSSKWPSYDSLRSTPSFLLSESEQTEDEADIFSEGEGDIGVGKSLSANEGIRLSGHFLDFADYSDKLYSHSDKDHSEHCPGIKKHPDSAPSPGANTVKASLATPGDLAFAQKCAELHIFICPLVELLRGLKAGRFEKGLTSFQQSVAMDRLQRILGILQKPEMGKYLHNLLQIEMMLKIWFPHVARQRTVSLTQTITPRLTSHWCQNQLHMPVKKRKLAWSEPDHSGTEPPRQKPRQPGKHESCQPALSLDPTSTCLHGGSKRQRAPWGAYVEQPERPGFRDSTLGSRPSCPRTQQLDKSPLSTCDHPVTQDNSVSSSAAITTRGSP